MAQFGIEGDGEYGSGVHYGSPDKHSSYTMDPDIINYHDDDMHVPPAKGDMYYRYARDRSYNRRSRRRQHHPEFDSSPFNNPAHILSEAMNYLKYVLATVVSSSVLMAIVIIYLIIRR